MAKVKVLIEGHDKDIPDGVWYASSTTTLVQDKDLNIIVDPGINRKLLLERLSEEGLKPEDIDYVLITHWHVDHFLLLGVFSKAKFLDGTLLYDGDKAIKHKGIIPETEIKIISTPGHEIDDCSLIVPTREGTVAIVGDIFWWKSGEKQILDINRKDSYAKNEKELIASRKKTLEIADFIVPGHGKMMKVKRSK